MKHQQRTAWLINVGENVASINNGVKWRGEIIGSQPAVMAYQYQWRKPGNINNQLIIWRSKISASMKMAAW
jgi:hypothetical protein